MPARLVATVFLLSAIAGAVIGTPLHAQSDLDALMQRVAGRRDESWKQLQQYILDERESIEVLGPAGTPVWGERREFTWYIREGFFVRSPLTINAANVSEADRRRYEADYLRRMRRREAEARDAGDAPPPGPAPAGGDVAPIIQQTRTPEFISSANFLRFQFDAGRYALVGRESFDGRSVLKIEYYPTRLFEPDAEERRRLERRRRDHSPEERAHDEQTDVEVRRLMNKGSLVTLWVDPALEQIVKYTFENAALDFFPGRWLVYADRATASMTMAEAFPGIWLPASLAVDVDLTAAFGEFDLRYSVAYRDYRRPDVTSTIRVPGAPEPPR